MIRLRDYNQAHPDPAYHAEWAKVYARRAILLSKVAMALAVITVGVSLASITRNLGVW